MKKRVILLLIVLLCFIGSLYFDSEIVRAVYSIQNYAFTELFLGVTFISSEIIIFFFLTSMFLWSERKRKWILPLWITLALSAIIGFLLKIAVQRPRPFETGIISGLPLAIELLGRGIDIWNFSFPSFQAALAFSALPLLDKEFKKLKYAWLVIAVIISLSRVYFGVHYMSDVIFGAMMGYIVGLGVVKIKEAVYTKNGHKIKNKKK